MARLLDCFGGAGERGSISEAARALEVERSVVSAWNVKGCIPLHHAENVERVTKRKVLAADILEETTRLSPRKLKRRNVQ